MEEPTRDPPVLPFLLSEMRIGMEGIMIGMLAALLILAGIILFLQIRHSWKDLFSEMRIRLSKDNADAQNRLANGLAQSLTNLRQENDVKFNNMETHLERTLNNRLNAEFTRASQSDRDQAEALRSMKEQLLSQNHEAQEKILRELVTSIQTMNSVNSERLQAIQQDISQKLDQSLNERLDSSFEKIGSQLNSLYRTVGELQNLANGVDSLNRTLSNVKTRGTWGEMQLEQILANIFPPSLYEKNAQMKPGTQERVEYAIRIPDKSDENGTIYLPIDSKFPADIYSKLQNAAQTMDAKAMEMASRELENRIRSEAKDISSKYLNPPDTTDFAVMFLPSEGLYAEVLRIPGLAEYCQKELKVILSGPTTISALLNSIAVGFRFLTVSRNTQEVLKVLQNVKGQYNQFGELIDKTQRNLDTAVRSTEAMKKRSDLIRRKLEKVSALGDDEADQKYLTEEMTD